MLKHVFSLKYNYLNKDVAFCPHKASPYNETVYNDLDH